MKKFILPVLALSLFSSCAEEEKKNDNSSTTFTVDSAFAAEQATVGDKTKTDTSRAVALPAVELGDIIMQNRDDDHSQFVTALTGSKYNNMGLIFQRPKDNLLMVMSVTDSVKPTPLTEWVSAGKGQHVALLRIKNANIFFNEKHTKKLQAQMKTARGIPYDPDCDWSDDQLYASEFVYKTYHNGLGIVLCQPVKLSTLHYSDPLVKKTLSAKYPNGAFPLDMDVVTPDMIYHSEAMDIIFER